MQDNDPNSYEWLSNFIVNYLWPLLLAMLGGLVKFLNKLTLSDMFSWASLFELIKILITSAFVGLLTLWACEYAGLHEKLTSVLIAISGHMGVLAITEFENMLKSWVRRFKTK